MKILIASILFLLTLCTASLTASCQTKDTICISLHQARVLTAAKLDLDCTLNELDAAKIELRLREEKLKRKNRVIEIIIGAFTIQSVLLYFK